MSSQGQRGNIDDRGVDGVVGELETFVRVSVGIQRPPPLGHSVTHLQLGVETQRVENLAPHPASSSYRA